MPEVLVEVEYCGKWGYEPKWRMLSQLIQDDVPSAQVPGAVGRIGSFDIKINGVLVYSKMDKGVFPNFDDVVAAVKEVAEGKLSPEMCQIDCC